MNTNSSHDVSIGTGPDAACFGGMPHTPFKVSEDDVAVPRTKVKEHDSTSALLDSPGAFGHPCTVHRTDMEKAKCLTFAPEKPVYEAHGSQIWIVSNKYKKGAVTEHIEDVDCCESSSYSVHDLDMAWVTE